VAKSRRRSRAIVGGAVVVCLAVAAGTVVALDYSQAKSNAKQKKVAAAKKKVAPGVQVLGVVAAVGPGFVTLRMSNGKPRRVTTTKLTRVRSAASGHDTDVKPGTRAVLRMKSGAKGVAQEVLVLPLTAKMGQPIAKAGFGFVWLRTKAGKISPKINVLGAAVDIVTVSSRTAIKAGTKVLVHAQATVTKPVRLVATEIILMPSNTTFVG
jgi:hypothetical protein